MPSQHYNLINLRTSLPSPLQVRCKSHVSPIFPQSLGKEIQQIYESSQVIQELNVKHIHIPNTLILYTFNGVYEYICVWHLIQKFYLVSLPLHHMSTYLNRLRNGGFTILLNEI